MRPSREHATWNEQTYFVTSETWARRALFRNERWAGLFVDTLNHYRGKAYLLHEFVVMPDHFHIIITPTTSLEKAVQFIKGGFSHRAKVELGSKMEVWQKGFSDHRIRDAEDYANHVEYIHLNPVKKGLCSSTGEYAHSSAHEGFELDLVPQRLKPLSASAADGAAKAAPFQNRGSASDEECAAAGRKVPQRLKPLSASAADGTAKAAPFQNRGSASDEECAAAGRKVPQRLKPLSAAAEVGAAEAAPFQSNPQRLKPAQSASADGTPKGVSFRGKTKTHA